MFVILTDLSAVVLKTTVNKTSLTQASGIFLGLHHEIIPLNLMPVSNTLRVCNEPQPPKQICFPRFLSLIPLRTDGRARAPGGRGRTDTSALIAFLVSRSHIRFHRLPPTTQTWAESNSPVKGEGFFRPFGIWIFWSMIWMTKKGDLGPSWVWFLASTSRSRSTDLQKVCIRDLAHLYR